MKEPAGDGVPVTVVDSEFHETTRDGAVRLGAKIVERLREATANSERRPDTDIDAARRAP